MSQPVKLSDDLVLDARLSGAPPPLAKPRDRHLHQAASSSCSIELPPTRDIQ